MGELILEVIFISFLSLYPTWKIWKRAGFFPPLALLVLIPVFGMFILWLVLAFMEWPAKRDPAYAREME